MKTDPTKKTTDATSHEPATPVTITISKNVDVSIPTVVCSSDALRAGTYRLFDMYTDTAKLRATCAKAGKYSKKYNRSKDFLSKLLYRFFKTGMLAIQAAAETGNPKAKPELILTDLSEMIGVAYDKALAEISSEHSQPAEALTKSAEAPATITADAAAGSQIHRGKFEK